MPQPGVMIYFEVRESILDLTDEEKGQLFMAILEYGEMGVIPEFTGALKVAWRFIRRDIDRDMKTYADKVAKRKYASYCKNQQDKKLAVLSFDDWRVQMESHGTTWSQMDAHGTTWYPTTTTTTTPTLTTTLSPTSTSTPTTTPTSTPTTTPTPTPTGRRPLSFEEEQPEDFETRRQQRIQMLNNQD